MIPIPTITQLAASLKSSIETQLQNTVPATGKSFLRGLINTLSGALKLLYLVLAFVQRNVWPDTADPESKGGTLERFGRVKLGRNPFKPRAANYQLTVTGSIGATIPASTQFKSNDDALSPGIIYILDEPYTLSATSDSIIVRALTAGIEGKLNNVDKLTATAPIALVDSIATVSGVIIEPLAGETTEEYRISILKSFRLEAQGGSDADYRIWALDAQGIKEVYPYARSGYTGEVNLYAEATVANSIDGMGTPSALLLSELEDVVNFNPDTSLALNERGRRPTQVIVNYLPITPRLVDIIITGAVAFTAAEKSLIQAALVAAINNIRPFVAGADVLADKNDFIDINQVIGVIVSQKPGAVFTSVTIKVDTVIFASYIFTAGDIPFPNSVTYV